MIMSDRERAKACQRLLVQYDLEYLWDADEVGPRFGPTTEAADKLKMMLANKGLHQGQAPLDSKLSYSEGLLLRVAFDFWNGGGGVSVWEMLTYLEPRIVRHIANLLTDCSRCTELTLRDHVSPP